MEEELKGIISYYKEYLIKKVGKEKTNTIISSHKDIINYIRKSKKEFKKLKILSDEYKLYDENYNKFMIYMGKSALGLEDLDDFLVNNKYKNIITEEFLKLHNSFEELEQINIMKDVYVWKFVN